ncbi:LOW QUALITY PROTEIN: fatty acid-binding protein 5-like [Sceloporus undulatus]|uniref:LOW QUALITY PROTEIN: fatty acid-binding protein 5-like n=1 Tax=Sceloporus undulatus TaxID=8520 RepID=UPI001C4A7FD5|nr:LOW QUALITY PROTEIN: fatty acid-binding protein 5-like [Sceloporus undulatus]
MANPDAFLGNWRLISSECFDEYMKTLGVSIPMRMLGGMAKPDITISRERDKYMVKTESTFKTSEFSFKLGEKFGEDTIDGRKTQTLITLDYNNVLTQHQQWDGKETTITSKIVDGKLVVECVMNGVKCTQVYQKV